MPLILIGLDDTDNLTSPGTGQVARGLWSQCLACGHHPTTVTRHQFLVDPRIAYTTHNSGACVTVETAAPAEELMFAMDFVAAAGAPGSDPGVCVAPIGAVTAAIVDFGRRAAVEVLTMAEAHRLAESAGLALRELGGTGLGIIGALASVAQRAEGNQGRVIDMPGLRLLPDRVTAEALTELGISIEYAGGRAAAPADAYETLGWVRPRLLGGRAVWPVSWSEEHNAWIPVDTKRNRPLE